MDYNKEYVNSGISFTFDDYDKDFSFSKKFINVLARILIVSSLVASTVFAFTTMMNINLNALIVIPTLIVSATLFTIILYKFKKKMLLFSISLAVSLGICACFSGILPVAAKVIYYTCEKSIYASMKTSLADSGVVQNSSNYLQVTLFFALCAWLLSLILSLFISGKTNCYFAILFTLPVFAFGMIFGCVPNMICAVLYISAIFASAVLHIANRQKNTAKLKDNFKKSKEKDFTYKEKNKQFGISALTTSVCVLICFSIALGVFGDFSRSEELQKTRVDMIEGAVNAYDLVTGEDHDASMKDGLLYKYGDRRVKNRHYFTLTTNDVNTNLYFKGFTGSIYTGFSWKSLDNYDKLNEFIGYLYRKKMSLATLSGDMLAKDKYAKKLNKAKFTLSDFRRNKPYMYILNGTVSSGKIMSENDSTANNDNLKEYSYKAYYDNASLASIPYTSFYSDPEFRQEWTSYCNFVNSNYTLLPEGVNDVARLSKELSANNVYELVDVVRDFLAKNTSYSDEVTALPDDQDFVSYFIYENLKGYSPHYATAAAVILRSFGVPARYCEGFFVPSDQISKAKTVDNKKQVEITDGNAHAWIEVFDANYGWVPVEVTPGYYQKSFAQTVKSERSKAQKDKKKKVKVKKKNEATQKPTVNNNNNLNSRPKQNKNSTTTKNSDNKYIVWIVVLGSIFAAMLIFVLIVVLRRKKKLSKRKAIFNSSNYKAQVISAFGIIIDIMKFIGIPIEESYEYDEFKMSLKQSFVGEVDEKRLDSILEIYEKALFSKQPIYVEDSDEVIDFLDEFGFGIYKAQTFKTRLKFKYLKVLI